jgi:hypothetical protein
LSVSSLQAWREENSQRNTAELEILKEDDKALEFSDVAVMNRFKIASYPSHIVLSQETQKKGEVVEGRRGIVKMSQVCHEALASIWKRREQRRV